MSKGNIQEIILRDSRYPVHAIADKLLPYIKLLVEKFEPDQVVLFGSYAYGHPTANSDVDLLIIKKTLKSLREEATEIRKAFRPLRHTVANLAFDIMVRDPEDLRLRLERGAAFHSIIMQKGLRLA
jgi:predicted nucleotidyltransferase